MPPDDPLAALASACGEQPPAAGDAELPARVCEALDARATAAAAAGGAPPPVAPRDLARIARALRPLLAAAAAGSAEPLARALTGLAVAAQAVWPHTLTRLQLGALRCGVQLGGRALAALLPLLHDPVYSLLTTAALGSAPELTSLSVGASDAREFFFLSGLARVALSQWGAAADAFAAVRDARPPSMLRTGLLRRLLRARARASVVHGVRCLRLARGLLRFFSHVDPPPPCSLSHPCSASPCPCPPARRPPWRCVRTSAGCWCTCWPRPPRRSARLGGLADSGTSTRGRLRRLRRQRLGGQPTTLATLAAT